MKGSPQTNFLAVTGMVADPQGNLVKPPRGPLNLAWLFHVSAETARKARERLAQGNIQLDADTLAGWFCLAAPADQMALDGLEQKAWRKSLKIWKGQEAQPTALHNRATLHRLMYLSQEAEHRGGHLRKAVELYHRLAQGQGGDRYLALADWSFAELEKALQEAQRTADDEMVAKSLLLILECKGMAACETAQEQLMLSEVDDLALLSATLVRELLPFQGVVHPAPRPVLSGVEKRTEEDVLPLAVRLSFRLVPGSRQRRRVDAMVAELCALLAQSLFKAGDGRQGKKWHGYSERWEPTVAEQWKEPEKERLGDEQPARVRFPKVEAEPDADGPRSLGPAWLGIRGKPSLVIRHESREEWLEAVRFLGLAVFPLRRFAVYRNTDTGDVGRSRRLPLLLRHYLWQAAMVVLISLALLSFAMAQWPHLLGGKSGEATQVGGTAAIQSELDKAVGRLKRLAQAEATLRKQPKPDEKRLKDIDMERQALFEKVQKLERSLKQ